MTITTIGQTGGDSTHSGGLELINNTGTTWTLTKANFNLSGSGPIEGTAGQPPLAPAPCTTSPATTFWPGR